MFKSLISMTGLAAAALIATVGTASALSCAQPNFAQTYNWLNEVDDVYYVGLGTMTPVEPAPPRQQAFTNNPVERQRRYRFSGGFLQGNNVTVARNYAVQTVSGCAGPWCGNFPEDAAPTLIFLKVENGGATFSHRFDACPGGSHTSPTNAQIRAIQACLRQGSCGPAEVSQFGFNY